MGKWLHRLSDIDLVNKRAVCTDCGPVAIKLRGKLAPRCKMAMREKARREDKNRPNRVPKYRANKGGVCERCGFVPEVSAQLEIHHKDGNHSNNTAENLMTVCANCHRLYHWSDGNKPWDDKRQEGLPTPL